MRCPPEMCMERPHATNRFRWVWAICQPDAHWVVLTEGAHEDREIATRQCKSAYFSELTAWEMEIEKEI